MTDMERTITKLKILRTWCVVNHDHGKGLCVEDCRSAVEWLDDVLALLKEQEPKPPIITENAYGWKFYHCPSCGREFYGDRLHGRMDKATFCDQCGQAVKWNG